MSLAATTYQPTPASSHYNYVTPSTSSCAPIEVVSDALWDMKPSFAEDPSLTTTAREYLDSKVDTLCGYTKTPRFTIHPSHNSAMESFTTAVDQAQASLVETMCAIPLSERDKARDLLRGAYGAVLDMMTGTHAASTSPRGTPQSSAIKYRNSSPGPSTVYTHRGTAPSTFKRHAKADKVQPTATHSRPCPNKSLPATSTGHRSALKSRTATPSTVGPRVTSDLISKPRETSEWPPKSAKIQACRLRDDVNKTADPSPSEVLYDDSEEGMISVADFIEKARLHCLETTGSDGDWGEAVEQWKEIMTSESARAKFEADPMSFGAKRR